MNIKRILLNNYRNYTHSEVYINSKCVFLYGLNGAGKTNLLEAISIFGPGNGIKNANLSEIARSDRIEMYTENSNGKEKNDASAVSENLENSENTYSLENSYKNKNNWSVFVELNSDCSNSDIPHKLGVENSLKGKKIRINGKNASIGDVARFMKVLSFVPGVDRVFIDTASIRRRFFNNIIAIFDASYVENVTNYEKLVRERMKILQKYSFQGGSDSFQNRRGADGYSRGVNGMENISDTSAEGSNANGVDRWLNIIEKKISELIVKIEMSRLIFVNNINNFVKNRSCEGDSSEKYVMSGSTNSKEHSSFPPVKILFESEMLNWKVKSIDMGSVFSDLLQSAYIDKVDKDFDMNIAMENLKNELENELTDVRSQTQDSQSVDSQKGDANTQESLASETQESQSMASQNHEKSSEMNNGDNHKHNNIVNSIIKLNSLINEAQQRCGEVLKKNRKQDTFSKKTNFGCHRSDFNAFAYGTYANHASTGQQKIIVLSIILTVCRMYSSLNSNKSLILLLDEVISHIDDNHKSSLFFEIFRILNSTNNLQVFMSATNREFLNSSLLTKLKAQIDVIFVKMNKMHLEEVLKLGF